MNLRHSLIPMLALPALMQPLHAQNTTEVGYLFVQQNDNANTTTSVTVTPSLSSFTNFTSTATGTDRGDFRVIAGNGNSDRDVGAYIVSVAQNGRDNTGFGDTIGRFYAGASPVISTAASATTYISAYRMPNGVEVNIDVAAGFFPYQKWPAGFSVNAATLYASPGIALGQQLVVPGTGVNTLDLRGLDPEFTPEHGVLLANESANNSTFFANTKANANGTFTIYTRNNSNGANGAGAAQRAFTFVYFPLSAIGTDGLTALGRINSDASTDVRGGDFAVTKGPAGRWFLRIDDHSPDTGTLLVSPAGGDANNTDNILSYEWDPVEEHWVIESRDIVNSTTTTPEDGATDDEDMFSFAFFAQRLAPAIAIRLADPGQILTDKSTFKVLADAADADGEVVSVQFFRNGQPVGTDTTAPYELEQENVPSGLATYTAVVTDDEGRATTSNALRVQVYSYALTTEVGTLEIEQHGPGNAAADITVSVRPGSATPNFEAAGGNRGDFNVRFGNANDVLAGTVVASIAENGRDNDAFGGVVVPAAENPWVGTFFATTSIEGAGASFYYLPVNRTASGQGTATVEVNINVGVGFFPYGLWMGGYARNSAGVNGAVNDELYSHPSIRLGEEFQGLGGGVFQLDLRAVGPGYTPDNGIVLANHAKNEGNHATVQTNADGTFTLYVRDNAAAAAGNEQDPISFVYIPVERLGFQGLQALGRVKGNASTPVLAGPAVVTKGPVGRYYLSIPGENADTGTLLISAAGGEAVNRDNVVSYQWDPPNQRWIIESRDLQTAAEAGTTAAAPKNPVLEDIPSTEDAFHFAFFKASAKKPAITLDAAGTINGRAIAPASFTVAASASDEDGQVVEVEFFVNGISAGRQNSAPYELSLADLEPGSYEFTARARDNDDYVTLSQPLLIQVVFGDELPANTALWFDGVDDHVALPVGAAAVGAPPTRGFTLECWFRREGAGGQTATSQAVALLPLIAKGRQEGENNVTDVNYLFGVTPDGKLGVDFEAIAGPGVAGGANFPLVGVHDSVETGRWHHAAATYDALAGVMRLYLDGVEVGARATVAGARPRFDSNHAATIGTAYNTAGVAQGAFAGVIDEVRIWDHPRDSAGLLQTMSAAVKGAAGLVARFGLDEGQGKLAASSLPDNLTGALLHGPIWTVGAPLNNQAPRVALTHPLPNAVLGSYEPLLLAAAASDEDGAVTSVEFYADGLKLGASMTPPHVIEWTDAAPGARVLTAVVTDDQGVPVQSEPVTVHLLPRPGLLLTEAQSAQSATAPAGAADYWELTNVSAALVDLEGYTWTNAAGDFATAQAWACAPGTVLAAGESVIFTGMDPADFRAWWNLSPEVRVTQCAGSPDLGEDDTVRLFNAAGEEVLTFSYAAGGFSQADGQPSLGGHAGASGGGSASTALVWLPASGVLQPRYTAAVAGEDEAATAATGEDVGSPGRGARELTPMALLIEPAVFRENAANPAASGLLIRGGDTSGSLVVSLASDDTTAAIVPLTVAFPAGADSVRFDVTAVDDNLADGLQVARITATGAGMTPVWQDLVVEDDEDELPPEFLLTEVQSAQSPDAPEGAADYFEITHFGDRAVPLAGYTWDNDRRDFSLAQAWGLPAGARIEPGESVVITRAEPAAFRAWWGLAESVKVYQTAGAPDLGQNDSVTLYTSHGIEVFQFSYATGAFTRQLGFPAAGGHAGISAGGAQAHLAAVWDPASSFDTPTYLAANPYRNGGRQAAMGTDTGSPGVVSGAPVAPPLGDITTRGPLQFELVASLQLPGAEISAFDAASKRLFVTGSSGLQILDLRDPAFPELISLVDFTQAPFHLNSTEVTSVAVHDGVVAVAVPNAVKQDAGWVVFLTADTQSLLSAVTVGVLPDMVCFTPDGSKVLTADEGEMLADGSDPAPGSVSVIDVSGGFAAPLVTTIGFEVFDAVAQELKDAGVRLFEDPLQPGTLKLPSLDFEPEYIAVSPDSSRAMVTLQEANAVALLDLETLSFTGIVPLGVKDFSALLADFSDQDGGINPTTGNPVFGLYMPDAIASFAVNGQTYYVTANEGDDRDDFMTETIRAGHASYQLDPAVFPNATELKQNNRLGRLVVSNSPGLRGDDNNDGLVNRILAYGARSISILAEDGSLVWDSGDMIERLMAELGAPWFDDSRSDNKGAEPEGVTIGEMDGRLYAFVALERARGVMAFEITDPGAPKQAGFVSLPADLNPESITFIPAADSPNGQALLAVTNETSRTLTLFNVSRYTLQLLHLADAEAGLLAPQTAPMLAALVEAFEDRYENTLILAGGDNFIPGPFLSAGTDPLLNTVAAVGKTAFARPDIAIHNLLGVEASAIGNHEWDLGSAVFMDAIRPDESWAGAQFPHLSVNLDFSADSAALARFTDVPLDGAATAVPAAGELSSRLAPMAVVAKGGQRLGLVGVTTQILNTISAPTGTRVKGATANDLDLLAAQLQPYVDELEAEGVNKIILLSHLQQLELELGLAGRLRGVDVILAAGSNTRLGDDNDVPAGFPGHAADFAGPYPVVSAGADGAPLLIVNTDNEFTYLGRLLMDFDLQGRIVLDSLADYTAEAGAYAATAANVASSWGVAEEDLPVTAFAPGTRGAAVRAVTEAVRSVIDAKDGVVHGFTEVYLEGEHSQVRSQETNLGNLTADANLLALLQRTGAEVPLVSIKNGGGIRAQIGAVSSAGGSSAKLPPLGNPGAGKPAGGVSQLDVENALRFNHRLMTFETTPQGLKEMLEHGVAAWPNQGRFPQVGGLLFAFDPARPAGDRITSIALLNEDGSAGAALYKAGPLAAAMLAQAPPLLRVVTLNFLANGGDGYPMKTHGENFRYLLADGTLGPVIADKALDFTAAPQQPGNAAGEQAALAAYLQARHGSLGLAYLQADTAYALDTRIQNLRFRADSVPPLAETDSDGDGLSDLDELLMGGNPFAALRVGDFMDLDLSLLAAEDETLRLLGRLPAGVRFDPVTGRLRGLIGGSPGLHDLQVLIRDSSGGLRAVNLRFAVEAFPARLLAGYEALLESPTGQPLGIVRANVTKPGSWSAHMELLGTARRTAKGSFALTPGEQRAVLPMVFKASKTAPETLVTLTLDADSPLVSGGFANGQQNGLLRGFRLVNFGGSPPEVKRLTTTLDAGPQDGVNYPAGLGWTKGTVNKSGALNLRGQLGDAQALALTTRLGATGQALIWSQPYRNKSASFFGGMMTVPPVGQPAVLTPAPAGDCWWFKAADEREKAYASGFAEALAVTVIGSGFAPVKTAAELGSALGLTGFTVNIEIAGGGLSPANGASPALPASWTLDAKFALLSNDPESAPWKGKILKADGGLTGAFTLPAGVENLGGKAATSGVLLPAVAMHAGVIGAGLIKVPVPGVKGAFRTASLLLAP